MYALWELQVARARNKGRWANKGYTTTKAKLTSPALQLWTVHLRIWWEAVNAAC